MGRNASGESMSTQVSTVQAAACKPLSLRRCRTVGQRTSRRCHHNAMSATRCSPIPDVDTCLLMAECASIKNSASSSQAMGAAVPEFRAIGPDGREVSSLELVWGAGLALLFWSPTCPHCSAMVSDLEHWAIDRPLRAPNLVLVRSGSDEVPSECFGAHVVLDVDGSLSRELGSVGTPSAVLVDRDGAIASPVVAGGDDVRALLGMSPTVAPVGVAG